MEKLLLFRAVKRVGERTPAASALCEALSIPWRTLAWWPSASNGPATTGGFRWSYLSDVAARFVHEWVKHTN